MKLMGQDAQAFARLHRLALAFAVAVIAAALAAVLGAGSAGAAARVVVLGAAASATPSCPGTCQAVGKTTGFQTSISGQRNPFAATFRGRIVAWSIKTGAPSTKPNPQNNNQSDYDFFTKTFGGPPRARISVLKPIMKQVRAGKPIYKLKSQSPVEDLSPYLGQTTTFTLDTPLRVKPNNVVALTVPTWAPALTQLLEDGSSWRASRAKNRCNNTDSQTAQTRVSQRTQYRCLYKARLTYSATLITTPRPNRD
jgi:hypothetical protein